MAKQLNEEEKKATPNKRTKNKIFKINIAFESNFKMFI